MAFSQDITALIPGADLDPEYLHAFLRANQEYFQRRSRGATIQGVVRTDVTALKIPLPPIQEQRRIASILDQADVLLAKRRQVLAHLDSLTQSIFYDMFGDPEKATDTVPLGSVTAFESGRSLVAADIGAPSSYRVLKISAVTSGHFRAEESKPLPPDYVPPPAHLIKRGDLLMSRANTSALVGAVALVATDVERLALPDKIWRFAWREPAEPLFYSALLRTPSIRRRISRLSSGTGGSMKNIAQAKLAAMPIPAIPFEQQRRFVAAIEHLYPVTDQSSLTEQAHAALFGSLQARAFRGDL